MAASDPIYIVTLKSYDDLDTFYSEMSTNGFTLNIKRPISRNTHYHMTEAQAVELRKDSRVLAVERRPEDIGFVPRPIGLANNNQIQRGPGTFRWTGTHASNEEDWGKIQHQGTAVQRRKGTHGYDGATSSLATATDTIQHFNDGRHVDIVVCDQRTSVDCKEWESLSTNTSRFKQYDWYTELNSYVTSIDDDGVSIPSAPYDQYVDQTSNVNYHGTHVTGTVAGKYYGWAPEADIYSMTILNDQGGHGSGAPVPTLLMFDYLRAFHRYKPINPTTGRRNPTITNHSWGYGQDLTGDYSGGFDINNISGIVWRGTTYNSGNPNPSGWTLEGIEDDFGFTSRNGKLDLTLHLASVTADVEDAINDGVVVICAAGNSSYYMVPQVDATTGQQHQDWDNYVGLTGAGSGSYYFCRGSSPGSTDSAITVGAMDNDGDHDRKWFSNHGPAIDIWAAGTNIVSAWGKPGVLKNSDGTANNSGTADTRHGGDNWHHPISGTSMASPQVAGVAACLATGKDRFTNKDLLNYIQNHSIYNDMTWNNEPTSGNYYNFEMYALGNGAYRISGSDKNGVIAPTDNPTVECLVGDVVTFKQPPTGSFYNVISGPGWTIDKVDRTNYVAANNPTSNPTIQIEVGDAIDFSTQSWDSTGHPFYIKTANTTGAGDQVTTGQAYGQGAQGVGASAGWDTSAGTTVTPGTYYYVCGNHPSMSGQIVVSAQGDLYNHPLYLKTQAGTGSGNQVTGATNQGAVTYTDGFVAWQPDTAGTYYYQCGIHASMVGQIVVGTVPGNLHAPGAFGDTNCKKDSPDRYLHLKNPRETTGYVGAGFGLHTLKGPRPIQHQAYPKPTTSAVLFPRQNSYHTPV